MTELSETGRLHGDAQLREVMRRVTHGVIFTSGDTMQQHGATNTLRLLQVGDGGCAEGLGEL